MYQIYHGMPVQPAQFNYFADAYENPVQTYYIPTNLRQHVPQYVLPYAGIDLRCLPWSKVMEILEKQAETYKLFQINAAYGLDWANEQNCRLIMEFNEQFRKEVELISDEQSMETLSVFQIPCGEKEQMSVKETPPVPAANPVEGSKKRKRTYNKKGGPKKLKKGQTVDLTEDCRYSPVVSPISPSMNGSCDNVN